MKTRILALVLIAALAVSLAGCSAPDTAASAEPTRLKFSDSIALSAIQALAGKPVTITGYMATMSPLDGKYFYLLNLPYQSCPFCVPNTTELANTMAVYAKSGKTFDYTERAVRVTGTIELGDFSDDYGYTYNYRIVNAEMEPIDLSNVSEDYAVWQSVAEDGIVGEINAMFDYLLFVCQWTEYQGSGTLEDGTATSWYLYPGDAENHIADTGPYGFGSKSLTGYFPELVRRLRAISPTGLEDLVEIVQEAQALEQYARGQLASGKYVYDEALDKYTLDDAEGMGERFDALYLRFSQWLGKWEV